MSCKLTGDAATPRSIVIENDLIRVEYPLLSGQRASHTMYYKPAGAGGDRIHDDGTYGDYTYFVNTITTEPTGCTVLTNTPSRIEVVFKYTVTGFTINSQTGNSFTAYTSGGVLRSYTTLTFFKTIKVVDGLAGYFVAYHSDPELTLGSAYNVIPGDGSAGEHESGFALVSTVAFSSNNITALNPEANAHTSMNLENQTVGPWWAAAIHARKNYICFISTPVSSKVDDYQFNPTDKGTLVAHYLNNYYDQNGTGLPYKYKAFLGVVPYTMVTRGSEPTAEAKRLVLREISKIDWTVEVG